MSIRSAALFVLFVILAVASVLALVASMSIGSAS